MAPRLRVLQKRYKHLDEVFIGWDVAYAYEGKTMIASIFAISLDHAWNLLSLLKNYDPNYTKILKVEGSNGFYHATLDVQNVYYTKNDEPLGVNALIGNIFAMSEAEVPLHIMDIIDWGTLTGGS
ncbi:hypothetical protein key_127 [Erwinia phage KEY]|uniref:Uncharacterized protein n=1 Tax=Erwinia phage KEY TaxID=2821255 RepID=A0AAE7WB21_9CAUD|nr:hypothetical protein key_127 [Erwinia phage KEY]